MEVLIDAGKVNTGTGWRDVKLAVRSKRTAGEPATVDNFDRRQLPEPSAHTVVAAIERAEVFAQRVRAEANRLDITAAPDIAVLADGAEWIWALAADVFPPATGVLDAFHALEHIADAVKAVCSRARNKPRCGWAVAVARS